MERRSWLKRLKDKKKYIEEGGGSNYMYFGVSLNFLREFCPKLYYEASEYFSLRRPGEFNNLFHSYTEDHLICHLDELIDWVEKNAPDTEVLYFD